MKTELQARQGQAAVRILDYVMTATLIGDDMPHPGAAAMPRALRGGELTFDGVFRDQREVWPAYYPGWVPLTLEEFRGAWGGAHLMAVGP